MEPRSNETSHETADPCDLARFVKAQADSYDTAFAEIAAGKKRSHWMWYIFPQLRGLGSSGMAQKYAISGVDEAQAYLVHSLLGPRLQRISEAVLAIEGRSMSYVFGSPDDLKLCSCATLFAAVSPEGSVFHQIIDKHYAGSMDKTTLSLLKKV